MEAAVFFLILQTGWLTDKAAFDCWLVLGGLTVQTAPYPFTLWSKLEGPITQIQGFTEIAHFWNCTWKKNITFTQGCIHKNSCIDWKWCSIYAPACCGTATLLPGEEHLKSTMFKEAGAQVINTSVIEKWKKDHWRKKWCGYITAAPSALGYFGTQSLQKTCSGWLIVVIQKGFANIFVVSLLKRE